LLARRVLPRRQRVRDRRDARARGRRLLAKRSTWWVEQVHARTDTQSERLGYVWNPGFAREAGRHSAGRGREVQPVRRHRGL